MEQEALLVRIKQLSKDTAALVTDIRGYTYVDLDALYAASALAENLFLVLTVAAQGILNDPSA